MPKITRWFLKASFLYLVTALLFNFLISLALNTKWDFPGSFPVYIHLYLVGWVTNMIFGVILWMFPRKSREHPRGNDSINWTIFILLNVGLLVRAFVEPAATMDAPAIVKVSLVASALSQWLAAMLFVGNVWPRVKER